MHLLSNPHVMWLFAWALSNEPGFPSLDAEVARNLATFPLSFYLYSNRSNSINIVLVWS